MGFQFFLFIYGYEILLHYDCDIALHWWWHRLCKVRGQLLTNKEIKEIIRLPPAQTTSRWAAIQFFPAELFLLEYFLKKHLIKIHKYIQKVIM